jgi:hypothetical protein
MLVPRKVSVTADDKVFFGQACANSTVTRWRSPGMGSGHMGAVVRF